MLLLVSSPALALLFYRMLVRVGFFFFCVCVCCRPLWLLLYGDWHDRRTHGRAGPLLLLSVLLSSLLVFRAESPRALLSLFCLPLAFGWIGEKMVLRTSYDTIYIYIYTCMIIVRIFRIYLRGDQSAAQNISVFNSCFWFDSTAALLLLALKHLVNLSGKKNVTSAAACFRKLHACRLNSLLETAWNSRAYTERLTSHPESTYSERVYGMPCVVRVCVCVLPYHPF